MTTSTPYVASVENRYVPTVKAYRNETFLNSHEGRSIRIMTEFEEPEYRLAKHGVLGTILFFGSARCMTPEAYQSTVKEIEGKLEHLKQDSTSNAEVAEQIVTLERRLTKLKKTEWMGKSYEDIRQLARRLTEWSMHCPGLREKLEEELPKFMSQKVSVGSNPPLIVTTGGGPGYMQAANQGSSDVPNAASIGMAISLPFEKGVNPYVTPELAFEFHYFFTRKFWMTYSAKALVVAPGGFGTCDELFEALTLKQTGKMSNIPIVLFGTEYWKRVINWSEFVEAGTISQEDIDDLFFTDDVEAAFEYITKNVMRKGVPLCKVQQDQKKAPDACLRMESSISFLNKF